LLGRLPLLVLRPRREEGDAFCNAGGDDILPLGLGHRVGDGPDALDRAFDGGGVPGLDHRGGGFFLLDFLGLHFRGCFLDFFGVRQEDRRQFWRQYRVDPWERNGQPGGFLSGLSKRWFHQGP